MSKVKCAHCRLKFDESAMIKDGSGLKFCCEGCRNVFEILNSNGFGEFYDRLGKNSLSPVRQSQNFSQNLDSLYQNYVKDDDGLKRINLVIDGIHCAACVWLIKKALFALEGVVDVNLNALNHKMSVVWDEGAVNLAEILTRINAVGYDWTPFEVSTEEARLKAKRREFYAKALVGVFCSMNIMWMAVAQWAGYFSGMGREVKDLLNFAQFVLATPALFYTGGSFFRGAYVALKNRAANMDLLVISGASTAYIYSVYAMFSRRGEVYFDSVAMIITFVFIGKFLEILTKKSASDMIDTLSLNVLKKVSVISDETTILKEAQSIKEGEIIALKTGDQALLDGIVLDGAASLDTSSISGEGLPIEVGKGDEVRSGSLCASGYLRYKATSSFENSLLNKIIKLLQNASEKRLEIEQTADKIVPKFSLVVLALGVFTFLFWLAASSLQNAVVAAVCVVIIACPCALALATPVSAVVGLGAGLKRGVIFKEARVIEALARCDTAVFDKTGTLTNGKILVSGFENFNKVDEGAILSLLLASNHPVSAAAAKFLREKGAAQTTLDEVKETAGRGISAKFQGRELAAGSARFMAELGVFTGEAFGKSRLFISYGDELAAKFELTDELRADAKECVRAFKDMGYEIYLLSGDVNSAVSEVAEAVGIKNFKAQCLPDEKAEFIKNLQDSGKRVLMVGDGINDAAAMDLADASVCMGSGAQISLSRSDAVLLKDDLSGLVFAVRLARKTLRTIRQNLTFSLVYNALALPLAVMGLVLPIVAAGLMSFSSLAVVLNALNLGANLRDKR